MKKYRKTAGKCLAAILSAAMALSLTACAGGVKGGESGSAASSLGSSGPDVPSSDGIKCGYGV